MAKPKRTKPERQRDLEVISGFYLEGLSRRAIAERLSHMRPYSLSHHTISRDVNALLAEWRTARVQNVDTARALELAKLGHIEQAAWTEWQKSCHDRPGDPRYLEQVRLSVAQRCKLLGLDSPTRFEATITARSVHQMTDQELEAIAAGAGDYDASN